MSKVADEIRHEFNLWKAKNRVLRRCSYGDKQSEEQKICDSIPFEENWMYNYLFPELLIVAEDFLMDYYSHVSHLGNFKDFVIRYSKKTEGLLIFPCWVMSEENVLRVMAECGIL